MVNYITHRCCCTSSDCWRKICGHKDWWQKVWFPHSFCSRSRCCHTLVSGHHDICLCIYHDTDLLKGSSFRGSYEEALPLGRHSKSEAPFDFSCGAETCWQGVCKQKGKGKRKDSASYHPLWCRMLCFCGNASIELYRWSKGLGSPQRLGTSCSVVSTCLLCALSRDEEGGKHFFLLSLVYVIDAGTSNFQDKRSISRNGHTGNLCANK